MSRRPRSWVGGALLAACVSLALAGTASAQISPGPLSRVHRELEGSSKCLSCHDRGQALPPSKCFACHQQLESRVKAGLGLHSRPEYADCKHCHIEHQGLEVELVFWGKAGISSFDHSQAGFRLQGRHSRLECRQCHEPKKVKLSESEKSPGLDRSKTFLGLGTACVDCHADPHQGQLAKQGCLECHSQDAWKPAGGFDHSKSFPLTGRHQATACERCHPPAVSPASSPRAAEAAPGAQASASAPAGASLASRRFSGAPRECVGCHADLHRGRLGANCAECHSTSAWRGTKSAAFDHERTAYPLRGAHRRVACERCHRPGQPLTLRHDTCAACHADAHQGQLAKSRGGATCEGCHDLAWFRPARFGPEEHQALWPLEGGHLAVPCDGCHPPATAASLQKAGLRSLASGPIATPLFRLGQPACSDCHRDPHRATLDRFASGRGCAACHGVSGWRGVAFDHAGTGFALEGRHARVACEKCHPGAKPAPSSSKAPTAVVFTGASRECAACHVDPHRGQFAREPGASTACQRCHSSESWQTLRFDHERDARWARDGAHKNVACVLCHPRKTDGGADYVLYRPVPMTCSGCHRGIEREGS